MKKIISIICAIMLLSAQAAWAQSSSSGSSASGSAAGGSAGASAGWVVFA